MVDPPSGKRRDWLVWHFGDTRATLDGRGVDRPLSLDPSLVRISTTTRPPSPNAHCRVCHSTISIAIPSLKKVDNAPFKAYSLKKLRYYRGISFGKWITVENDCNVTARLFDCAMRSLSFPLKPPLKPDSLKDFKIVHSPSANFSKTYRSFSAPNSPAK